MDSTFNDFWSCHSDKVGHGQDNPNHNSDMVDDESRLEGSFLLRDVYPSGYHQNPIVLNLQPYLKSHKKFEESVFGSWFKWQVVVNDGQENDRRNN